LVAGNIETGKTYQVSSYSVVFCVLVRFPISAGRARIWFEDRIRLDREGRSQRAGGSKPSRFAERSKEDKFDHLTRGGKLESLASLEMVTKINYLNLLETKSNVTSVFISAICLIDALSI
jgi:hypothetical protein